MLTHTTPKYRCFTAFILALLWASPASAASDGAFIRGDANADGAVDIADAKSILSYLFHGARLGACGDAADANDDGTLDMADARMVLDYLFMGADPLPPPNDFKGYDITPTDEWTCGDDPIRLSLGMRYTCVTDDGETTCSGRPPASEDQLSEWSTIGTGEYHMCGIDTDGYIRCDGSHDNSDFNYEPHRTPMVELSGGRKHHCGITEETGSLYCWGKVHPFLPPAWVTSYVGTRSGYIPRHWGSGFKQVSATSTHTCALRDNGEVECAGDWRSGQADEPDGLFHQISAGSTFTCGLRPSGTAKCWGWDAMARQTPKEPLIAVAAGGGAACGIRKSDGSLTCWTSLKENPVRDVPEGDYRSVAVGATHACAISVDDDVVCWGNEDHYMAR